MGNRPYVLLSAAMSADGYIDDASDSRLVLSDAPDLDRVDEVRAACDAILVGAGTIRADNPRLVIRSRSRRNARTRRGVPPSPVRVTLTSGGELDSSARFFHEDGILKLVYAPDEVAAPLTWSLGPAATVVETGEALALTGVLLDLADRGIERLMVEGGSSVLAQFLANGLADELQLAVAPLFVADPAAPRLLGMPDDCNGSGGASGSGGSGLTGGSVPDGAAGWRDRARLAEVGQTGRMAVLRYELNQPEAG